jgi:hypothetical protein
MANADDKGWFMKVIFDDLLSVDIAVRKLTTFCDALLLSPGIPSCAALIN